jgi:hypothetical protein
MKESKSALKRSHLSIIVSSLPRIRLWGSHRYRVLVGVASNGYTVGRIRSEESEKAEG